MFLKLKATKNKGVDPYTIKKLVTSTLLAITSSRQSINYAVNQKSVTTNKD